MRTLRQHCTLRCTSDHGMARATTEWFLFGARGVAAQYHVVWFRRNQRGRLRVLDTRD
jgi:hypothetical protein